MKQLSKFELAGLKRTAQNVECFVKQKNKLKSQIEALQGELAEVEKMIEVTDAYTVTLTGYHSEDIITRVCVPTDKTDKNGKVIVKCTYEFKYPDTIIPPVTDSTEAETEETDKENIPF